MGKGETAAYLAICQMHHYCVDLDDWVSQLEDFPYGLILLSVGMVPESSPAWKTLKDHLKLWFVTEWID